VRTVLCAYCARENPKKIQSSKNNPKKFPKKLQKFQIILLDTQPNNPGRTARWRRRTDGRESAFCVWIRFRVVNGGMMDGTMDGTMEGWNDGRGWTSERAKTTGSACALSRSVSVPRFLVRRRVIYSSLRYGCDG
jgi:hypothetical protein